MSRGLGPVQNRILTALRQHDGEVTLERIAWLAAGLIDHLAAPVPSTTTVRRAVYVSVVRAVSGLRRRGLVATEIYGMPKGTILWTPAGPRWKFRNPSRQMVVRLSIDTLPGGTPQ